ncbi:MAG: response regulator transcription factor [Bacteroidota bacterium]
MNAKILLVEDELALARLIQDNLIEEGFLVEHSPNGEAALKRFFDWEPDLVILDVMMPRKNGFKVATTIRDTDRKTPIIFLTAKIKATDVVKGFQAGGNDYIRKPFAMAELLVRIQALLQQDRLLDQPALTEETRFELGRFTFDSKRMRLVDKAGKLQKLTTREAELLQLLCQNRNHLVTKSSILLKVWGDDSFFNSRSLDVFISRLRKYLKAEPSVNLVNLRGVGYKLVTD